MPHVEHSYFSDSDCSETVNMSVLLWYNVDLCNKAFGASE